MITNLSGFNSLQILYALIKINRQDINKCNVLISCNKSKKEILNLLKKEIKANNLKQSIILNSFNFQIINLKTLEKVKLYTKLGNYDIGFSVNNFDGHVYIASGTGYKLAREKELEFMEKLNEFEKLTSEETLKFFLTESKKESIKCLTLSEIKERGAQEKYFSKINFANVVNEN